MLKNINIKHLLYSSDRSSKATRQIIVSFFFKVLSIAVGILYIPLLLDCLSQEKYGVWLTLVSIFSWFSFFDVGLGNGLRNKLSEAFALSQNDKAKVYVSTTYFIVLSIFSVVFLLFHIANIFIDWNTVLNTDNIGETELYQLTSIVFSFVIIRFVVQLIAVIYKSDQRSSVSDVADSLSNALSFLLVLLLSYTSLKNNLTVLGSVISIMPVLMFITISVIAFRGKYKFLSPSIRNINVGESKGIVSLGGKFFFLQVTAIVMFMSSNFFVAQIYGPEEVVVYNIVYRYFQVATLGYSILASPYWSAATDAYFKKDFSWLSSTLKTLNVLTLLFTVGIIIMVLLSEWVYELWFNNSVHIPPNLTYAMALYTFTFIVIIPYSYFLNGFGKIKLTMILTVFELISYLALVYFLSLFFDYSISIVFAFILSRVCNLVVQPIQVYKIVKQTAHGVWNQ